MLGFRRYFIFLLGGGAGGEGCTIIKLRQKWQFSSYRPDSSVLEQLGDPAVPIML